MWSNFYAPVPLPTQIISFSTLSYQLALVEGGHIAQNFLLLSSSLSLKARPTFTLDFHYLGSLFELDTANENFFYGLVF